MAMERNYVTYLVKSLLLKHLLENIKNPLNKYGLET